MRGSDLDILQLSKQDNGGVPLLFIMLSNIYRDGVSEGQFYQVLLYELDAIRKVLGQITVIFIYIYYDISQCLIS